MSLQPWILTVNIDPREMQAIRTAIRKLDTPCSIVERLDFDQAVSFLDRHNNPALVLTNFLDEVATIRFLSLIGANGRQRHIRIWVLMHHQGGEAPELCRAYGASACFTIPLEPEAFESRFQLSVRAALQK
jgi:hypothetical protein